MTDPKVFHKVSYGLYVISSVSETRDVRYNGQIANTIFQVSNDPEMIALAIHKENLTHAYIEESRVYSAVVLSKDVPMEHIGHFGFRSGRDGDKFAELEFEVGQTGAPIPKSHAVGFFEVDVKDSVDARTHTLFLGKVRRAEMISGGEPLTYAHYHDVKKGRSPEHAPVTRVEEDEPSAAGVWSCQVCGYLYDEEAEGAAFADLPGDWKCPVCGAGKDAFVQKVAEAAPSDAGSPAYRCQVCGYVYDPAAEGTAFADLPADWKCPVCGTGKDSFVPG